MNSDRTLTNEEIIEAKRYLGDIVTDGLTRIGVAELVRRYIPNCNCGKRRAAMNNFHKKLLGRPAYQADR